MDDKIIGLYAKRVIDPRHPRPSRKKVYGLKVSADLSAASTRCRSEEVSDWQNRALEPMYPLFSLGDLLFGSKSAMRKAVQVKKQRPFLR